MRRNAARAARKRHHYGVDEPHDDGSDEEHMPEQKHRTVRGGKVMDTMSAGQMCR